MSSHKLTKRHQQAIKKSLAYKGQHEQIKEAQRQRQQVRALRPGRPPRQREWDDADETPSREKMRRATALDAPASAGAAPVVNEPALAGTVIEVRSGDSLVSLEGRTVHAVLLSSARDPSLRSPIAVGDRVEVEPVEPGVVRIVSLLPRRSALVRGTYDPSRRDPLVQDQVLAANIDLVVIVCSPAEPPFRARLIDRYLIAASRDGLPATVCLNKTDLGVAPGVEEALAGYERLGAGVVRVSAASGDGIDALRCAIEGKVSLFSGHSGVGKSSLLNTLESGLALRVGSVTQSTAGQGKGRHTTSSARLVPLSLPETYVVDSPGIRAFGLRGMTPHDLVAHMSDLAAHAPACAYRDCLHRGEPGCAVEVAAQKHAFLRARLFQTEAVVIRP
ncbi:MAG: ribosome small subunit-dependent GTPase A [Dehalococcoidia bacterium]